MSPDTPYARAFRRAIETLGGAEQLAQAVGTPVATIEAYAAGLAHPRTSEFLRAIDVIAKGGWEPGGSAKY